MKTKRKSGRQADLCGILSSDRAWRRSIGEILFSVIIDRSLLPPWQQITELERELFKTAAILHPVVSLHFSELFAFGITV
jgi:hypothetical protein